MSENATYLPAGVALRACKINRRQPTSHLTHPGLRVKMEDTHRQILPVAKVIPVLPMIPVSKGVPVLPAINQTTVAKIECTPSPLENVPLVGKSIDQRCSYLGMWRPSEAVPVSSAFGFEDIEPLLRFQPKPWCDLMTIPHVYTTATLENALESAKRSLTSKEDQTGGTKTTETHSLQDTQKKMPLSEPGTQHMLLPRVAPLDDSAVCLVSFHEPKKAKNACHKPVLSAFHMFQTELVEEQKFVQECVEEETYRGQSSPHQIEEHQPITSALADKDQKEETASEPGYKVSESDDFLYSVFSTGASTISLRLVDIKGDFQNEKDAQDDIKNEKNIQCHLQNEDGMLGDIQTEKDIQGDCQNEKDMHGDPQKEEAAGNTPVYTSKNELATYTLEFQEEACLAPNVSETSVDSLRRVTEITSEMFKLAMQDENQSVMGESCTFLNDDSDSVTLKDITEISNHNRFQWKHRSVDSSNHQLACGQYSLSGIDNSSQEDLRPRRLKRPPTHMFVFSKVNTSHIASQKRDSVMKRLTEVPPRYKLAPLDSRIDKQTTETFMFKACKQLPLKTVNLELNVKANDNPTSNGAMRSFTSSRAARWYQVPETACDTPCLNTVSDLGNRCQTDTHDNNVQSTQAITNSGSISQSSSAAGEITGPRTCGNLTTDMGTCRTEHPVQNVLADMADSDQHKEEILKALPRYDVQSESDGSLTIVTSDNEVMGPEAGQGILDVCSGQYGVSHQAEANSSASVDDVPFNSPVESPGPHLSPMLDVSYVNAEISNPNVSRSGDPIICSLNKQSRSAFAAGNDPILDYEISQGRQMQDFFTCQHITDQSKHQNCSDGNLAAEPGSKEARGDHVQIAHPTSPPASPLSSVSENSLLSYKELSPRLSQRSLTKTRHARQGTALTLDETNARTLLPLLNEAHTAANKMASGHISEGGTVTEGIRHELEFKQPRKHNKTLQQGCKSVRFSEFNKIVAYLPSPAVTYRQPTQELTHNGMTPNIPRNFIVTPTSSPTLQKQTPPHLGGLKPLTRVQNLVFQGSQPGRSVFRYSALTGGNKSSLRDMGWSAYSYKSDDKQSYKVMCVRGKSYTTKESTDKSEPEVSSSQPCVCQDSPVYTICGRCEEELHLKFDSSCCGLYPISGDEPSDPDNVTRSAPARGSLPICEVCDGSRQASLSQSCSHSRTGYCEACTRVMNWASTTLSTSVQL